ncbi:MAG: YunC family protein [Candidatus Bathycorpusculaceae bacterium]
MIEIKPVIVNGNTIIGVRIGNPDFPEKPAIIVLIAKKGLIVCRNFDIAALNERGVTAVRVEGLTKIEDALQAKIESCTARAHALGIAEGMTGKEAIIKLQNYER